MSEIHHDVPRWYLRRWSSGPREEVCVFDRDGAMKVAPVHEVASGRDRNTIFASDGSRDDTIEREILGPIDSNGARAAQALLASSEGDIPAKQWTWLAEFIGWQLVRSRSFRGRLAETARELNERRAAGEIGEERTLLGSTGVSRGGRRLPLPESSFVFTREDELYLLKRRTAPDSYARMIERRPYQLRRLASGRLETCDAPVVYEDKLDGYAGDDLDGRVARISGPEVADATFLPLAPDALLAIGWAYKPTPDALALDDDALAARINSLIAAAAVDERYCRPTLLGA